MKIVDKICLVFSMLYLLGSASQAAFDCGSDGSDGSLIFDNPSTTTVVIWDPKDVSMVGRELDMDRDSVYHFTSINIPSNITLRFRSDKAGWAPIYWLCQGTITIDGSLDFSGEQGHRAEQYNYGFYSMPGSGGFSGGIGLNETLNVHGTDGFGPGINTGKGEHPGTNFLYPLTGGSGGAGFDPGNSSSIDIHGGGGAGGGCLLLAANSPVTLNGLIDLSGGDGGFNVAGESDALSDGEFYSVQGYGGAGGALRIISPSFLGIGFIECKGGDGVITGEDGWVRIETGSFSFSGSINCERQRSVNLIESAVYGLPDDADVPKVRIALINGIDLPLAPRGSFEVPDLVIDTPDPVVFEIEANNIPLGTNFTVILLNETEGVIEFNTTAGLTGTLASSSVSVSHAIPNGYTRGFVYAEWTNP